MVMYAELDSIERMPAVENQVVDIWSTSSSEKNPVLADDIIWWPLHLFSHCPNKIYIDMEGGASLPSVHNGCWRWENSHSLPWGFFCDPLGRCGIGEEIYFSSSVQFSRVLFEKMTHSMKIWVRFRFGILYPPMKAIELDSQVCCAVRFCCAIKFCLSYHLFTDKIV